MDSVAHVLVQPAGDIGNRHPVVERPEGIWRPAPFEVSVGPQQVHISREERRRLTDVLHCEPAGVPRHGHRPVGLEPAEVEESARPVDHLESAVCLCQAALGQVPVGHVAPCIADNEHVVEESGNEVEPTLVVVHALHGVVPAVRVQPVGPPVQEPAAGVAPGHTEAPAVPSKRSQQVRGKGDGVVGGCVEERVQRARDEDICVEKQRGTEASAQQVTEQVRFDDNRELLS